jgi:hypothetical protein
MVRQGGSGSKTLNNARRARAELRIGLAEAKPEPSPILPGLNHQRRRIRKCPARAVCSSDPSSLEAPVPLAGQKNDAAARCAPSDDSRNAVQDNCVFETTTLAGRGGAGICPVFPPITNNNPYLSLRINAEPAGPGLTSASLACEWPAWRAKVRGFASPRARTPIFIASYTRPSTGHHSP